MGIGGGSKFTLEKTWRASGVGTTTFNAPGNFAIPYGKNKITVTGKGAAGVAGNIATYNPPTYPYAPYNSPTYPAGTYNPPAYPVATYSPPTYPGATYNPPSYPVGTYNTPTYPTATYQPVPGNAATYNPAGAYYSYSGTVYFYGFGYPYSYTDASDYGYDCPAPYSYGAYLPTYGPFGGSATYYYCSVSGYYSGEVASYNPPGTGPATYNTVPGNIASYNKIPGNAITYNMAPGNAATYNKIPGNIASYNITPGNPSTYNTVPGNAESYGPVYSYTVYTGFNAENSPNVSYSYTTYGYDCPSPTGYYGYAPAYGLIYFFEEYSGCTYQFETAYSYYPPSYPAIQYSVAPGTVSTYNYPTTGPASSALGVTMPGGFGGVANAISPASVSYYAFPDNSTQSVTVATGGYVTITSE